MFVILLKFSPFVNILKDLIKRFWRSEGTCLIKKRCMSLNLFTIWGNWRDKNKKLLENVRFYDKYHNPFWFYITVAFDRK